MNKCLCCRQTLDKEGRYHSRCLRRIFGFPRAPSIPFGRTDLPQQVHKTGDKMSISGVQQKLSVRIGSDTESIETVSEGGTHILKPEPPEFPALPQNENLCMSMAAALGMPVPPQGLFPMADGSLCYVVKRFDWGEGGQKLHKETAFQILGNDEDKYKGSLEQVGKIIREHAANVGLDSIDFFERVLLCFLTGNGDMHMKNWGFLTKQDGAVSLAPCYDLVSSRIYLPDEEDSAITLNGKKNRLIRADFEALAASLRIDPKAARNSFDKLRDAKDKLLEMCRSSELPGHLQRDLEDVIKSRYRRLYGSEDGG